MFKIFHEVLGTANSVIDFMFGNVSAHTPLLAVRVMKILKTFLCMASFGTLNFFGTLNYHLMSFEFQLRFRFVLKYGRNKFHLTSSEGTWN